MTAKTTLSRPWTWAIWVGLWAGIALVLIALQYAAHHKLEVLAHKDLQNLAHSHKRLIEQSLHSAVNALNEATTLALFEKIHPHSPSGLNAQFRGIVERTPAVATLVAINVEGTVVASNRLSLIGNNLKAEARYKTISGHPHPALVYVSEPFVTPLGRYSISLGALLTNKDKKFDGYVLAILSPAAFLQVFSQDAEKHNTASALVHDNGQVIFRYPDSDNRIAQDLRNYPGALFWQFKRSGLEEKSFDAVIPNTGKRNLFVYQRLHMNAVNVDHPLSMATSLEFDPLFAAWRDRCWMLFFVWLVLGCASTLLLLLLWRSDRRQAPVA